MQTTKESLIEEINRRVQDKILEPANAKLLIKLINNAESLDEAINIAALGTTYKRTGLHFDKRLEQMTDSIKYFKKNENLSFHTDDTKPVNKLIIGDNYNALQNLLIQYKGQIDVIYIDPPYGKDSMGEFAKTNYTNAITRDNLLSMLYPRLILAKQLLSDEGVIFCSIDDKNQAYVKCLFDEVFGEENFVANFIWKSKLGKVGTTSIISATHEYILCFAKKISCVEFQKIEHYTEERKENLRQWGVADRREDRPSMFFPIEINGKKVYPIKDDGTEGRWRVGEETAKELLSKGVLELSEKDNKLNIYRIFPKGVSYISYDTLLLDEIGTTAKGAIVLKSIGLEKMFDFSKPIELIKHFIKISVNNNKPSLILDFFAGSGTTGHAVLDLNKTDGGNRTFILCQINEKTEENPNGIAYDVTSKRLKRIMTGQCYDGTKDFPWLKDNEPYGGNLDVYEIESVANFETTSGKSPFDVIDETLYGKEKFETVKEKIEWVCNNFEKTQKELGE